MKDHLNAFHLPCIYLVFLNNRIPGLRLLQVNHPYRLPRIWKLLKLSSKSCVLSIILDSKVFIYLKSTYEKQSFPICGICDKCPSVHWLLIVDNWQIFSTRQSKHRFLLRAWVAGEHVHLWFLSSKKFRWRYSVGPNTSFSSPWGLSPLQDKSIFIFRFLVALVLFKFFLQRGGYHAYLTLLLPYPAFTITDNMVGLCCSLLLLKIAVEDLLKALIWRSSSNRF